MKKVNDYAEQNDHYAGNDNVLAKVTVHIAKLIFYVLTGGR
jgi:hypothetical protein